MLRLAEQCGHNNMAHQLGKTEFEDWPPLRGSFFGRTGWSFGRKKLLAPPKKFPHKWSYFWFV